MLTTWCGKREAEPVGDEVLRWRRLRWKTSFGIHVFEQASDLHIVETVEQGTISIEGDVASGCGLAPRDWHDFEARAANMQHGRAVG
jgi:hypothetical protein